MTAVDIKLATTTWARKTRLRQPLPDLQQRAARRQYISTNRCRLGQLQPVLRAAVQASSVATQEPQTVGIKQAERWTAVAPEHQGKQRVVLVGSGWAAATFLKTLRQEPPEVDLTVVSSRNYFLYTPLLPSTITGLVEERSIVEPTRALVHGKARYVEAEVLTVDPGAHTLTCRMTYCEVCAARRSIVHSDTEHQFTLPYDVLILAVGSVSNDFGVGGVNEHCWFLKTVEDAHKLRVHLSKAFEQAALPDCSPEKRRRLLGLVVVGGGPTGCEVAAELHDFFVQDVAARRLYPELPMEDLSITVINSQEHLLGAYDRAISDYAERLFKRQGITTMLRARVVSVREGEVTVKSLSTGEEITVPYGTCVWATGVAMHPLAAALKDSLAAPDEQTSMQGLMVDGHLRVKGAPGGSIFALGDCAVFGQERALARAQEMFARGCVDAEGRMARADVVRLFREAGAEYPHLAEFAKQLEGGWLQLAAAGIFGSGKDSKYKRHMERLDRGVTLEELRELIADMDAALRALPPTAQVARQEASYLAKLFSQGKIRVEHGPAPGPAAHAGGAGAEAQPTPAVLVSPGTPRFQYVHLGQLAYLGLNRAVLDLPFSGPLGVLRGWLVGEVWRGMETWMQISARNRLMVTMDWLRAAMFGRNMSDV